MKHQYFYNHPECNSLTTEVLSAEEHEGFFLVELRETIFYPEGGGQPADRGWIGNENLLDVQKVDGKILHKVVNHPGVGFVDLALDRAFRDHYARQHTGQHLLSALLSQISGASTLSVHLGADETTIETDLGQLDESELLRIEERGNREISNSRSVRSFFVKDKEELKRFSIRRGTDKSRDIRLVEIEGLDITPCGGLHVGNTAELGLIKYSGQERIRGRLRTRWKISTPAYMDYRMRFDLVNRASNLLSVKPEQTAERLEEILMEKLLTDKQIRRNREKEAEQISRKLSGSICGFPPLITTELKDCSRELFRDIVKNLSAAEGISFLLCSRIDGTVNWALHLPRHKNFAFDNFSSLCLPIIDGKGGGQGPLWQGSGSKAEMLSPFIDSFRTMCRLD